MTPEALRKALLYPDTVALIGASDSKGKLTARPQTFLSQAGFAGRVYPVNPRRETVLGAKAYATLAEVPEPVEHAYILLDAEPALVALEACGKAGVSVVSMLADGFAESGPEGAKRQDRLTAIAKRYEITLVGPNSTGVVETARGFVCTSNAAFAAPDIPTGRFAVLSQSGSMIGAMLSRGAAAGLGFHSFVSVGNEAMMGIGEIGQILVDDPGIEGFALFLETIRRPEELARFAQLASEAGKPVVAFLVGRSEAGTALAASHTGAMVGGARAVEAFLNANAIQRVDSFDALVETTNALRLRARMSGRPKSATVVTTTGGGGGMVYDQIGLRGVSLGGVSASVRASLEAEDGIKIKPGPLVDVTLAGTKYDTMKALVSRLIAAPETGLVVAAIGSSAQFNPDLAVRPIVDAVSEAGTDAAPIVAVPIPHAPESLRMFNEGNVPAFKSAESAAEAIEILLQTPEPRKQHDIEALPTKVVEALACTQAMALNEDEAGRIFADLGVPGPRSVILPPGAETLEGVTFDGPYVLKVLSRDIQHKSEIGGVAVGLPDSEGLSKAFETMRNRVASRRPDALIDGYLVQEMVHGLGEAIVGFTRDPVTGPMISVGLGGILTEIYRDLALRPAPVSPDDAAQMLNEVKGFALLRGFRGAKKGDMSALAKAVSAVSRLALASDVLEAEINPLLVRADGDGVVALDALIQRGDAL